MAAIEPRTLWLLLPLCALLTLLVGPAALAEGHEVRHSVLYYADTDSVSVLSPTVAGRVALDEVALDARLSFDIITAASVDLVTAASPGGFHEQRTELEGAASWDLGRGHRVATGYGVSTERDYLTHRLFASHALELLDRHATLGASYSFGWSEVGRSGDAAFSRSRVDHRAEVSWTHVLSRVALLDLAYSLGVTRGYQENPYRFVRLYAPGTDAAATAVTEAVPDLRHRHTATVRVRAQLAPGWFGVADYRFYGDSWGVLAQTLTLRAAVTFWREQLTIALDGRGYYQNGASFYRARYETFADAPVSRTSDKELGPMWTVLGGIRVEYGPRVDFAQALRLGLGCDVLHMRYLDFAYLQERTALMVTAEIVLEL